MTPACAASRFGDGLGLADTGFGHPQEGADREATSLGVQRSEDHRGFSGGVAQIIQQQYAAVWLRIAMDQRPDVVVLGKEHPAVSRGFRQKNFIARFGRPLSGVDNIMARGAQGANGRRDNVGIGKKPHAIRRRW